MTDYLEPYRRMVRSIRFVPPLARNQEFHFSGSNPVTPEVMVSSLSRKSQPETTFSSDLGPILNPSEHVAALVKAAVSKPTAVPVIYTIPENVGNRISRLAPPKARSSVIISPKIPEPDPNWTPSYQLLDSSENVVSENDSVDVSVEAQPTEVPQPQAKTPVEVAPQVEAQPTEVPQPQAKTPVEAPPQVEAQPTEVPQPQAKTPVEAPSQVEAQPTEVPQPQAKTPVEAPSQVEAQPTEVPQLEEKARSTTKVESSETEVMQIQCPKCGSTEIRKNGHRKNKQQYLCKDCGRQFVMPEPVAEKPETETLTASEASQPKSEPSTAGQASKSSLNQGKRKAKGKGFATKKAKK